VEVVASGAAINLKSSLVDCKQNSTASEQFD